ncbi:MAG: DUF2591 domain-containing protein [Chloroflexi bacterium]|nr:MAG: DUF2591 domain-containing protein [Chloroflexota bacterium]
MKAIIEMSSGRLRGASSRVSDIGPLTFKSAPSPSWKHGAQMVIRYQINTCYCTQAYAVDWKPRCLHTRPYRVRLL